MQWAKTGWGDFLMTDQNLPYLWYAKRRYPFYRRNGLIPVTTPDGRRLLKGDFGVLEAYERIHASFEAEKGREVQAILPGSIGHGISRFTASTEWKQQLKPSTQKRWRNEYNWLLRPPDGSKGHGHRSIATCTQEAVLALRDLRFDPPLEMRVGRRREREGYFPAAANALVAALSGLSAFVKRRPREFFLPSGWTSPTVGIPKLKVGSGYRPWEEEEIEKFYERWPPETIQRVIFDTYLYTGQRGIDVYGMARDHYRPRKRLVPGAVGIWASVREISVIQEKTGERLWIPAADELIRILDPWLASHDGAWFFMTSRGFRHMSLFRMTEILHKAIDKAGLSQDCQPHGLRVTFATRMIELSLDYQTIESIVGHTTTEMAIKYTEKRRKARLAIGTLNQALAAYRAGQQLLVDE
jgi:integrase